jgi:hypothetical protein
LKIYWATPDKLQLAPAAHSVGPPNARLNRAALELALTYSSKTRFGWDSSNTQLEAEPKG